MPYPNRPNLRVLALLLASVPAVASADARPQVGIMGLRVAQPGALSQQTIDNTNHLLWQAAGSVPGVQPRPEPQIADRLGAAARYALASCAADACMAQIGQLAGLDRVVYALVSPVGDGFTVYVRSLTVQPVAVLGQVAPTCGPCGEASVAQLVGAVDLRSLVAVGGTAAPPEPGFVSVTSKPKGARVTLGGRFLGNTPLKRVELPAGTHRLRLDYAGYLPAEVAVRVKAGGKHKEKVKLEKIPPHTGRLTVRSKPQGAQIALDGQVIGVTPMEDLQVLQGRHHLVLTMSGYERAEESVTVRGGGSAKASLKLKRVAAQTGRLYLTSKPSGAQVAMAGQVLGVTPLAGIELYPGEHTVVLSADHHATRTITVTMQAGRDVKKKVKLPAIPSTTGKLVVATHPAGAYVSTNGQTLGQTPLVVPNMPPGRYPLTIQLYGFTPAFEIVQVTPGSTTQVDRMLSR